jgi:hypothetical protein
MYILVEDKMKAKLTKEEMNKQAAEIHTGEVNALCDDIDRCLSVLASAIPPRLSVPLLLQGMYIMYIYVQILRSIFHVYVYTYIYI